MLNRTDVARWNVISRFSNFIRHSDKNICMHVHSSYICLFVYVSYIRSTCGRLFESVLTRSSFIIAIPIYTQKVHIFLDMKIWALIAWYYLFRSGGQLFWRLSDICRWHHAHTYNRLLSDRSSTKHKLDA